MKSHRKHSTIVQDHADLKAGRLPAVEGTDIVDRIHLARYRYAAAYTNGSRVLDIATGIGYGAFLLATEGKAKEVFGVDVSQEAIGAAKQKYELPNVTFRTVTGSGLPFENEYFDTIVSFETVEHTAEPISFLKELRRVLKIGGTLVISTPNKRFHSHGRRKPWNPFHTVEYYPDQFLKIVSEVFGEPFFWGGQELLSPTFKNIAIYNWIEYQYYQLRNHPSRSHYFQKLINLKRKLLPMKPSPQSGKVGTANHSDKRCSIEKWKLGCEPYTMVALCKK